MVGRLVEHEEIALGDERAGERHPFCLTARQLARARAEQFGEAEAIRDRRDLPTGAQDLAHEPLGEIGPLVEHRYPQLTTAAD